MSWIDLLIAIVLIYHIWLGLRVGLIQILFDLVALFGGLYLAKHYQTTATQFLTQIAPVKPEWIPILAFVGIFLLIFLAGILLGKAFSYVASGLGFGILNHVAGGALGCLKASIWIWLLVTVALKLHIGLDGSVLLKPFLAYMKSSGI